MNRSSIGIAMGVGGGLLCLAGLACLLPLNLGILNLLRFGAVPLLYLSLSLLTLFCLFRLKVAAKFTALAALSFGLYAAPHLFSPFQFGERGPGSLRILFSNIDYSNTKPEKLLPLIKAKSPDIVVIVESSPIERLRFEPVLEPIYPYRFFYGETHLFSKYPVLNLGYSPFGHTLQGFSIRTPSGPLDLEVIHLSRPWPYASATNSRYKPDYSIRQIIGHLKGRDTGRMIMVGDFNATASSGLLSDLSRSLRLSIAPTASGTWPSNLPAPIRVSFDNGLYGKSVSLNARRVLSDVGSDHRPVMFDFVLRQKR